jgi:hypothetical protein
MTFNIPPRAPSATQSGFQGIGPPAPGTKKADHIVAGPPKGTFGSVAIPSGDGGGGQQQQHVIQRPVQVQVPQPIASPGVNRTNPNFAPVQPQQPDFTPMFGSGTVGVRPDSASGTSAFVSMATSNAASNNGHNAMAAFGSAVVSKPGTPPVGTNGLKPVQVPPGTRPTVPGLMATKVSAPVSVPAPVTILAPAPVSAVPSIPVIQAPTPVQAVAPAPISASAPAPAPRPATEYVLPQKVRKVAVSSDEDD